MEANLEEKYYGLKKSIGEMGSVLVAFSGGTDSTLVLAVAKEVLGDEVLAATVKSPLQPGQLMKSAEVMALRLKARQAIIENDELENPSFVKNPPERCYLCKHGRYQQLIELANHEGLDEVVDGTQLDDLGEYRPGMQASEELGIRSPLLENEFSKYEIRALSRELGLSTWNLAASPCLATRFPYNKKITREKVAVIDRGEEFLRDLGMTQVRLRYIDDGVARIEVSENCIAALAADGTRNRVVDKLRSLGFTYVTIDLAGYRPGSMDETLEEARRRR